MSFRRRSPRTTGCFFRTLFFILITGFLGFMLVRYYSQANTTIISPLPDDYKPNTSFLHMLQPQKDPDVLRNKIKDVIGDTWDNYSVYVVDYNSKFSIGINESTIYPAASVNKVPILAAVYAKATKGEIDFDKTVTVQADDIQDYGTGSIRYDPPGSTYSIKTLVRLMTQKSDNTAAYILANYTLGLDTVQSYVEENGLTQTDMTNNKTSNKDMAILFDKIYHKKITSPALSDEMLGFLADSDFEDRLPALLPKEAKVYHKIGTGVGAVHDAGIVTHGKTAYYIGVFTSDVGDEEQAAALLAKISKTVFDYMDRN